MGWFSISVPRLHTVIPSSYVLPFYQSKKNKTSSMDNSMLCPARNVFWFSIIYRSRTSYCYSFCLQGEVQTTEYGDGNETERLLMIYLNIMICVMHFIRGAFHDSAPSMKTAEPIIQRRIFATTCAHTQHEFFDEILSMVLEILNQDHSFQIWYLKRRYPHIDKISPT